MQFKFHDNLGTFKDIQTLIYFPNALPLATRTPGLLVRGVTFQPVVNTELLCETPDLNLSLTCYCLDSCCKHSHIPGNKQNFANYV